MNRGGAGSGLAEKLLADLAMWLGSAWIVGLIRSRVPGEAAEVVGVFGESSDSALWSGYLEAISVCTRATSLADIDAELWRREIVQLLVPVEAEGEVAAMLVIGGKGRKRCSPSELSIVRDVCTQLGHVLRDDDASSREDFGMVHDIQDRVAPTCLSSMPRVRGLDCSGQSERSGRLGGDFFDICGWDASGAEESGLTAGVGNVSLAGNPGCILMTGLQACFRSLAGRGTSLPELCNEMNGLFRQIAPENAYASLFTVQVNARRGQLQYVNAGNQTSLIVRGNGRVERLGPNAPVLGLGRGKVYRPRVVSFGAGDTLLALSDGIGESLIPMDIAGCEAAMIDLVQQDRGVNVRELPARILGLIERMAGPHVFDRTVVVVYCRATHEYAPERFETALATVA